MKENLLKYIIFLFGSTFFLAEISTRIFIPQPVFTPRTYQHSDGLRTNKNSGSSVHSYFGRKKIKYEFNDLYTRFDSSKINDSKSNSCKFLVLGDSFVFGWLVDYENTFVSLIEENINRNNYKYIQIHNAARGGAGFDYYVAFTKKFKKELSKYNGIIVFLNSDDAQRILRNDLYKLDKDNKLERIVKTSFNTSLRKKINNNKFLDFLYSFSLENSNLIRLMHNFLMHGGPLKKFNFESDSFFVKAPGVRYKFNKLVEDNIPSNEEKMFLKLLINQLAKNTKNIPITLVYIGSAKREQLSGLNKFFYSNNGLKTLIKNDIGYDFSLFNFAPIYDQNKDLIIGDWHPNEDGHKKIAEAILQSNKKNSIKNFISLNCKYE